MLSLMLIIKYEINNLELSNLVGEPQGRVHKIVSPEFT
jgi:hypothetical protein